MYHLMYLIRRITPCLIKFLIFSLRSADRPFIDQSGHNNPSYKNWQTLSPRSSYHPMYLLYPVFIFLEKFLLPKLNFHITLAHFQHRLRYPPRKFTCLKKQRISTDGNLFPHGDVGHWRVKCLDIADQTKLLPAVSKNTFCRNIVSAGTLSFLQIYRSFTRLPYSMN